VGGLFGKFPLELKFEQCFEEKISLKIIVVGSGGREHAIAWKLLQSPEVQQVFCLPGNGGTALLENCVNIPLDSQDFAAIAEIAQENQVDLVVVGPEIPLAQGLTDYLQPYGISVFGPNQAGAQIEASKAWAKEIMLEAEVATARSQTFSDPTLAKAYIREQGAPIVIKADGLASGKGVVVAPTLREALAAIDELEAAGFSKWVVEEFLVGEEVSVLALTDGTTVRTLVPAQDHKQIGEGDTGKNTGGMGAYAPTPLAKPDLMRQIEEEILIPVVQTLAQKGIDYRGVLYAGLMISPTGEAKVLEFNCRFGDPETQAILPLLQTPLHEVLLACTNGRLAELPPLQWYQGSAVCVVAAAAGYPDAYEKGHPIQGIAHLQDGETMIFLAGATLKDETLYTNGGRVLGVTAIAPDFPQALQKAYQALAGINFTGMYYRRDIGRALNPWFSKQSPNSEV
jgi:phosphoribosylamine--glycine ligase